MTPTQKTEMIQTFVAIARFTARLNPDSFKDRTISELIEQIETATGVTIDTDVMYRDIFEGIRDMLASELP